MPDPAKTTTFDFGNGDVTNNVIEDVESDADVAVRSQGDLRGNRFSRVAHHPGGRADDSKALFWARMAVYVTLLGIVAAVVIALAS